MIALIKSPLAPLCLSKDREKITKEGCENSVVLPEPVTEGLLFFVLEFRSVMRFNGIMVLKMQVLRRVYG